MAYRTENPANGVVEKEYGSFTDADVDGAIEKVDGGSARWRAVPPAERAAILGRVSDLYGERSDELARAITTEMGKPLAQAKGEVALASSIFRLVHEPRPAAARGEDPRHR